MISDASSFRFVARCVARSDERMNNIPRKIKSVVLRAWHARDNKIGTLNGRYDAVFGRKDAIGRIKNTISWKNVIRKAIVRDTSLGHLSKCYCIIIVYNAHNSLWTQFIDVKLTRSLGSSTVVELV